MNRDDIVRMWEKANNWSIESWPNTIDELERFAKLVAAAEREANRSYIRKLESELEVAQDKINEYLVADFIRARGQHE
jgi:hypothetical protein